jgi:outer membrane scaffolding protein for murein synthesis (MipA/OmpV family)
LLAGGDTRLTASELGPYAPGAGPRDLGGILALIYRPQPRLSISFGLFGGQFLGAAKDSPLVRKDSYLSAGLGFSYRLRNARPTPQD